jgi:F-type H+-transporting ATPase subunit c
VPFRVTGSSEGGSFVMKKKLLGLFTFLATFAVTATAFAQDAAANEMDAKAWGLCAAGLGIGLAAFGGALGQGRAAAAALEGIARNPNASGKLFVPMILGLALIESLVIYALIISFQILGAVG